jgi:hypothetical protein
MAGDGTDLPANLSLAGDLGEAAGDADPVCLLVDPEALAVTDDAERVFRERLDAALAEDHQAWRQARDD